MLENWKLTPALATGSTIVLNATEFTTLSVSLVVRLIVEQLGCCLVERLPARSQASCAKMQYRWI